MPVSITEEIIEKTWIDADQTDEGVLIGMTATWKEESEEVEEFTKVDFERALRKVSRKVKK